MKLVMEYTTLMETTRTILGITMMNNDEIDMGGMQITIVCPGGRYIPMQVKATDTLGEIKQRTENHTFVPKGLQRLSIRGNLLEGDDKTLMDLNVQHGALVDLKGINLHVHIPERKKTITLEVIPLWYIKDVKKEIVEMEDGLDMELIKLKRPSDGKELTNKPNLKYYNIVHNDTIELEIIPTYDVEMSAWQNPFGYVSKDKIKREGKRARKRPTLKDSLDG